jgi:hypothetical protein
VAFTAVTVAGYVFESETQRQSGPNGGLCASDHRTFPTTSNRAPHSEPRTPEISALWAGLVPSTVHAWLGARAQLFHHPTRPSPTPPARHRMLYGPRAHKSFVLHPPPHAITCEDPHECLCASATWHICPADSAMRIHAHAMASSKFPVPRSHDPPSAFPCRFRLASRRLARRMPWPPAAEAPRRAPSRALPWAPFRARHRPRRPPRAPVPQR